MSNSTMTKTIFLPTTPEVVWSYLTEQDKLAQWFHPSNGSLVEGKEYELLETQEDGSLRKVCWGTVVSMNKPSSMEWTFTVNPLNGAMTTVRWTLEACTGGTRLTLSHEGVEDAAGEAALGHRRSARGDSDRNRLDPDHSLGSWSTDPGSSLQGPEDQERGLSG